MTIAAVQRVSKGFSGASSCAIGSGDGWATPTSGNLIVLTINCDRLCSTPSGYTAGSPVEDDNAVYLFWKISAGTETTPTITPIGGTTTGVMTACEYSGVAASPSDGSNTSSIVGSVGTTTTSTSVTTTAPGDLIIAVAGLAHYTAGVAAPSSPTWTNSFVNQITVDVGAFTSNHACTFYAELAAGAAGAYATSCSWTTGMLERQELIAAFTAAATATEVAGPYRGPAPGRISPTGLWSPQLGVPTVPVTTPTSAEGGPATLGLAASGTAVHVGQLSGSTALGLAATGTAKKVVAQSGTCTLGPVGSGIAVKKAPQAGPSVLGLAGTVVDRKVIAERGSATLGLAGTGTDKKLAVERGTSALGLAATGTGAKKTAETGQATLGLLGVHSGTVPRQQTGLGFLGLGATAVERKLAPAAGRSALGLAAAGTAAKKAPERGTSALGLTATRISLAARSVTGRLFLGLLGRHHDCTTHRPTTGTTARPDTGVTPYALATTSRPDTGITARPDTGVTEKPC